MGKACTAPEDRLPGKLTRYAFATFATAPAPRVRMGTIWARGPAQHSVGRSAPPALLDLPFGTRPADLCVARHDRKHHEQN